MDHARPRHIGLLIGLAIASAMGRGAAMLSAPIKPAPRNPKPKKRRLRAQRGGGFMPHQSARECARRRGGEDWRDFKALDRMRRGLSAEI